MQYGENQCKYGNGNISPRSLFINQNNLFKMISKIKVSKLISHLTESKRIQTRISVNKVDVLPTDEYKN